MLLLWQLGKRRLDERTNDSLGSGASDAVLRRCCCASIPKVARCVDLGRAETRNKRQYRVLRIPKAVVEKFLSTKAGHPVRVDVPPRPERRRKSDDWETHATLNLAKAGLQNVAASWPDRKTFDRIAERAAFLARAVPQDQWVELLVDLV